MRRLVACGHVRIGAAALSAIVVLAGCSGGSSDGSDVGSQTTKASSTVGATASTSASQTATTAGGLTTKSVTSVASATSIASVTVAGDDTNPLSGKDFCAMLAADIAALKSAGSATGALVQLTLDLTNFMEEHPDQQPRTADDLDSASSETCPDLRNEALTALEAESFSQAFG